MLFSSMPFIYLANEAWYSVCMESAVVENSNAVGHFYSTILKNSIRQSTPNLVSDQK